MHLPLQMRNKAMRGASASLRNSANALLCRQDLTVGIVVTELEKSNCNKSYYWILRWQGLSGGTQPTNARWA
jgi:hypothetical protein